MTQYSNLRINLSRAVLLATVVTVTAAFGVPASASAIEDRTFEQVRSQEAVDFEGETTVCENGQPCERHQTVCQPNPESCRIVNELLNSTIPSVPSLTSPNFPFGN